MKWVAIGSIVLLAALFAVAIILSDSEKARYRSQGSHAKAVVTDKEVSTRKTTRRTSSTDRCFSVKFEADGKPVTGYTCDYVSQELYDATAVGAEVEVVYFPKALTRSGDVWSADDVVLAAALAD